MKMKTTLKVYRGYNGDNPYIISDFVRNKYGKGIYTSTTQVYKNDFDHFVELEIDISNSRKYSGTSVPNIDYIRDKQKFDDKNKTDSTFGDFLFSEYDVLIIGHEVIFRDTKVIISGIAEDIDIDQSLIKFDYSSHNKKHINTKIGKGISFKPRKTTLKSSGVVVYSMYNKTSNKDTTDILKSIKKSTGHKYQVDDNDYQNFIKRVVIYFTRLLKKDIIDIILIMPSSSPLIKDVVIELLTHLSLNGVRVYDNAIYKDIDNIKLIRPEKMSNSEYFPILKYLDSVKKSGQFEIKKIHPKHRSYVSDWIKIKEEINLKNKNVVIFDDYITSGSTMDAVCVEIIKENPESIKAMTIIK